MKKLLLLYLSMFTFLFSIGQIKGTLLNPDSMPVELAVIKNSINNSSTLSNAEGEFLINGIIGDSIRIQHINYSSSTYRIDANNASYVLSLKEYNLPEIVVSSNYASQLFKKSSENTFNRLKYKSISRGYLRFTKVVNNDTLVLQDLDLDIKRQRLKSFDQGEKISVIKIQERSVSDSVLNDKTGSLKKYIYPPVNIMKWDLFSKSYNYYKVEDSEYIKLYFINKKNTSDNLVHFEVIIQKEDSCLSFIAVTFSGLSKNKDGSKELNTKSYSFIKYGFADGISFLSETFDRVNFQDPKKKDTSIEMTLCYKTYNNGVHNLVQRPKGRVVYKNIFNSHSVKNKYGENFWINNSGIGKVDYDFTYLVNMQIKD